MTTKAISAAAAATASSPSAVRSILTNKTYFISGPIDCGFSWFLQRYAPFIELAIHGLLPSNFVPAIPSRNLPQQPPIEAMAADIALATTQLVPFLSAPATTQLLDPRPGNAASVNAVFAVIPPADPEKYAGSRFVVGDAPGTDLFAQVYLLARLAKVGGPSLITVHHMGPQPRSLASRSLPTVGGFSGHTAKDAKMTEVSDIDIAHVRSVDEQKAIYGDSYRDRLSGTEKNLIRRLQQQQQQPSAVAGKKRNGRLQ